MGVSGTHGDDASDSSISLSSPQCNGCRLVRQQSKKIEVFHEQLQPLRVRGSLVRFCAALLDVNNRARKINSTKKLFSARPSRSVKLTKAQKIGLALLQRHALSSGRQFGVARSKASPSLALAVEDVLPRGGCEVILASQQRVEPAGRRVTRHRTRNEVTFARCCGGGMLRCCALCAVQCTML